MNNAEVLGPNEYEQRSPVADDPPRWPAGSPRPGGPEGRAQEHAVRGESKRFTAAVPPLGRALPGAAEQPKPFQRAVSAMRTALPFLQRLLPLLDGNVGATVSNLLAPRSHTQNNGASPSTDLAPLSDSLTALQTQHQELRYQMAVQSASLKRVEDQLEMVREATDRNTLEQQELFENLKTFSHKSIVFAVIVSGLLAVSIVFNVIVYLQLKRVLP